MARRKRKRSYHRPTYKKLLKSAAGAGATFLIAGPVLAPGIMGIKRLMESGDLTEGMSEFTYQAAGYSLKENAWHSERLPGILMRDAALVGIGLGLRWANKRI